MIFLIFVCAFFLYAAISVYKKYFRLLKFSWNLEGPKCLPIIGNGLQLANKSSLEFVQIVNDWIENHGKYFRIWIGDQLFLLMIDPKDVEGVLSNSKLITKSSDYDFMKPWLGTGLLTSTGSKWLARRKIITPAFHFSILEDFVSIFDHHTSILVEKLRGHEGQGDVDIFPMTALCALDVIGESSMGISLNAQNKTDSEYIRNVNELADIIHHRTYNILHRLDALFVFTPTYRRQQYLIKKLHEFTDSVILARREKLLMDQSRVASFESDIGKKKKSALLDILLQSTIDNKPLSNQDIREEIDTFIFRGHDTTNSAIAFALLNIAKRPDIQQKCFNEIRYVIGDDVTTPVDMKLLNELKYLELVVKESLRLYPSVPIFARKVLEDVVINTKNVPKGTSVLILPYFMARNADLWENPLEFIPERFTVETTAERMNPYTYIPFSAGSRNCIGQKFAMLEIKSTVSKILRNYELSVSEGFETQDSLELVIKSKNGVRLKLQKREYN